LEARRLRCRAQRQPHDRRHATSLDRFNGKNRLGQRRPVLFRRFGIQSARQTYLLGIDALIWEEKDVAHDGFISNPSSRK